MKRYSPSREISLKLKVLTWINICIQVCFPLAVTFTPLIASAGSNGRLLTGHVHNALQTRIYTLAEGEDVASVAKKYNISLDALKKLNQLRPFAQSFEHLKSGDQLVVPALPLTEVQWEAAPSGSTSAPKEDDLQAQKIAGYASQFGGILGNHAAGNTAASMARGMAGGEIQQWLSHFGTARVQLEGDKGFSLKNSQLDLLVPLYQKENSLIFTQGSIHRTDDRTQSNLGFGYRWFAGDQMLGANTFLDYDLSREHKRMGLGVEYWRNFLKLGVNTYHRLTGWKDSPDFEDYEERPANGWDVRAQYWLPALPQLGGKLTYEQYYGNEVALFGRDNRQRNPRAITLGLNYTPIPLLTFGAEQRQGESGRSDTRFNVDIKYQLGVPWQHQINPDSVAAMRSLAGSRYDLVERNNNILLEYRKKEVIRLKTVELIKGYAGEQKSLGVSVTSKYGLDRIDWSASALIAAGGKIVQQGADWNIILPEYQSAPQSVNTYTVSGVAVDKKGNTSSQADTQVTVTQASIDTTTSSLSPSNATLPANGVTKQEFILKVNDKEGRPVDIAVDEINVKKTSLLRGVSNTNISAFTRRAAGEYVMTVTAGTMPEAFTITISARNTQLGSVGVTTAAENSTAMVKALDEVDNNAIADGKSQNKFRVTVVDAQNNPVPAQSISLKADHGATVVKSAITEADGTVVVPVTSHQSGEITVTASIKDKSSKMLTLSFSPDKNTAKIEQKNLSVIPEISLADGKTQKTITALVTDAQGNPVPDMPVTFSADNGATLAEQQVKTDTQGSVTTTLTSSVAGTSHVVVSVNNKSVSKETTFTGNSATANVNSVETTTASGVADGVTMVTFRALVKDNNGNPLSGIPVDWKSNKDDSIVVFNRTQTVTSNEGIAEVQITSTQAFSDVLVTASTNSSSRASAPFTFVADTHNPVIKSFSSNIRTLKANGTDTARLNVSVTDTNGNPLPGVEVAFGNDSQAKIDAAYSVTDANGAATASLSTLHAGQVSVSASVDKGSQKSLTLMAVSDEQTAEVSVKADTTSATAGQSQPVTLTATVVDANKNPVSGTPVVWQTNHNNLSETITQTNAEGKAKVQLTGTKAVLTTVTAMLSNSHTSSTQITFGPGEPDSRFSQLSVSPNSLTADGQSEAQASLILRDEWDNPVTGKTVDWNADKKSGINFAPVEIGTGVYKAAITGTAEGIWDLHAQIGSIKLQTPLALLASQNSAQIDSVTVTGSDSAKADGQGYITIRTQVKDAHGNTKLKGLAVGWNTTLGTLSSNLSTTDDNGVAEITLRSHVAGIATVSAMLGGGVPVMADKTVSFTAGVISADKSSLSLSPASVVAGKENATLRVTARDQEGNLLPGLKDEIHASFSLDLNMTVSAFKEASLGIYEANVSGKKAGTTQISADVDQTRITSTASLTLRANNDTAIVKGNISATPASATVGDNVTYTAVLTDINDNALGAGIPVTWNANEGSVLSSQVTSTDASGRVQVTLSRQMAGTAHVNLILSSGTTTAPDVVFSAGDVDENLSELTLTPSVIVAGKETAALTLTLRDSNGNLLTGKSVSGQSDNSNVNVAQSQEDNSAPGNYTMRVTSNKAGSATLSVQVGNKKLKKSRILRVQGDNDSWKLSTVTSDKTRLTAGDTQGVTYSATVTDANGNLLNNVVVSWQLSGQADSFAPASRTNAQGVATTTVKSNTAGILQMTAYLDEGNHIQAGNVTVVAGDIKNATFSADKTTIGSDGKDTVTLTASLEDTFGNPVTGKTVIIEGANSLAGFKLSPIQDQQNGNYIATGTAITKGQVTLNALVDGKQIGHSVKVSVGAITPDLRFDNAEQPVTWTKSFKASQSVKGMPKGVIQNWSSSDPSVATVDANGKVTLLKSGSTNVSVYTPGNAQYTAAMASYTLNISRADPGLTAGAGGPITAVWADGIDRNITASYINGDVQNSLSVSYSTKNAAVVTVDTKTGKLTAVKPGTTTVNVSTPETDQFRAASVSVSYVLNKATADVSFTTSMVETNDESAYTLQSPDKPLPPEVSSNWESSNRSVIDVTGSGDVTGAVSKGQTRLTLTVAANDYYNASSGYYDVKVFSKPYVNLSTLTYTNAGTKTTSGSWKPLFTNDFLEFSISSETSNEFSAPVSLMVNVVDEQNNVLKSLSYTTELNKIKEVQITPNRDFFGKTLHVVATAIGHANLSTKIESAKIPLWSPAISDVAKYISGSINYYITLHNTLSGTTACKASFFEGDTDMASRGKLNLNTNNRDLILPIDAKLTSELTYISGVGNLQGEQLVSQLTATKDTPSSNTPKTIYTLCWWNHGKGIIQGSLSIKFNGKEKKLVVAKITEVDGEGKHKDQDYPINTSGF